MYRTFAAGLLLALVGLSPAGAQEFKVSEMEKFLSSLKGSKEIPVQRQIPQDPAKTLKKKVPAWIRDASEEVQNFIFGAVLIDLKYCSDKADAFRSHYSAKLICLHEEELDEFEESMDFGDEYQTVVKFLLTRELGRVIQEMSIQLDPKDRSLNGNFSTFRYGVMDYSQEKLGFSLRDYAALTPAQFEQLSSVNNEYFRQFYRSHAEIDAYAYIILKRMGKEIPFSAIKKIIDHHFEDGESEEYFEESSKVLESFKAREK